MQRNRNLSGELVYMRMIELVMPKQLPLPWLCNLCLLAAICCEHMAAASRHLSGFWCGCGRYALKAGVAIRNVRSVIRPQASFARTSQTRQPAATAMAPASRECAK